MRKIGVKSPEAVYHVPQHSSWRRSTSAAGKTSAGSVLQGMAPRQLLKMDKHVLALSRALPDAVLCFPPLVNDQPIQG
jgi:hypothetical protein